MLKNILTIIIVSSAIMTKPVHGVETMTSPPAALSLATETLILKNYLSHTQIRDASIQLAATIKHNQYHGLVAITRGGLGPTLYLSEQLEIKDIRTISISSYGNDGKQGHFTIIHKPELLNGGKGYLFIDDLVDSGKTLKLIRSLYPKAEFAVLYAKPKGKDATDFFAVDVPQDEWLVFPWEPDWFTQN
ncbi:MAG: xanthine phosphoribosyltransferase [Candidatus Paracaedibacteraceae bacterium]|nr:xanthine phosphoribosyltransferase [Candidatus Paracaedibacteraceae bacterium]